VEKVRIVWQKYISYEYIDNFVVFLGPLDTRFENIVCAAKISTDSAAKRAKMQFAASCNSLKLNEHFCHDIYWGDGWVRILFLILLLLLLSLIWVCEYDYFWNDKMRINEVWWYMWDK
jgi:hypothetical protein